nr:sensor domain-containing diguanylate cyclase [uncultured Ralstonia sp.]
MQEITELGASQPSAYEQWGATLLVIAIAAVAGWAFVNADVALPEVKPFLPIFLTMVVLSDGLTAYLLLQRARIGGEAFSGMLASAYVFSATIAAVQLPTFPGVFSATGLLGAGSQTAVWLWTFWHAGYPLLILFALLVTRWPGQHPVERRALRARSVSALRWIGPALAVGVALVCLFESDLLPPLIREGKYSNLVHTLGVPVIGANLIGLIACVGITRVRRPIDLWVAVALVAALADAILTLHGGARYTLGWYVARMLSVVSSAVVLCMLVADITRLYEALVHANRALEKQALIDGLTKLGNRQAFEERWDVERRRATREGIPLSVLMIDIDHFKQINDSYGHARGDACLVEIARVLAECVQRRAGAFVARYGGEEFIVILPNTAAMGAQHVAEFVRTTIESAGIPAAPAVGGVVTASIGHATYQQDAAPAQSKRQPAREDVTIVLSLADQALYEAKRGGRNRVAGA